MKSQVQLCLVGLGAGHCMHTISLYQFTMSASANYCCSGVGGNALEVQSKFGAAFYFRFCHSLAFAARVAFAGEITAFYANFIFQFKDFPIHSTSRNARAPRIHVCVGVGVGVVHRFHATVHSTVLMSALHSCSPVVPCHTVGSILFHCSFSLLPFFHSFFFCFVFSLLSWILILFFIIIQREQRGDDAQVRLARPLYRRRREEQKYKE